MNGENFKTFVNGNFNVIDFNIFLRLDTGEIKQLKHDLSNEQAQNVNKVIKDELKKFSLKTPKLYDAYKGKDEFLYLNVNDIGEVEELRKINQYLNSNNNVESCSSYPGKIKYIIAEVFTENESLKILTYYNYNQFFKKKIMGAFLNNGFSVEDNATENIIISFLPEVILYSDEIIFNSNNIKVFDMSSIFEKCINNNLHLIGEVFKINEIDKITKRQRTYLSRGIFNGNLEKFKNLPIDNKRALLDKFKEKYKEKYREEIDIKYEGEVCIIFDGLSPRQKEEIIKYTTNRSAYKVLDEQLTTSVD